MKIRISDPTLRDGNHAINHSIKEKDIKNYCQIAEKCKINIIEVGHGNGIGASSLQVGISKINDDLIIKTARKNLKNTKLGIHSIPGFSSIEKNLKPAIDLGVDVVRTASHCTESNTQIPQILFCKKKKIKVYSTFMMCHMISNKQLLEDAKMLARNGVDGVILMDSAGYLSPEEVEKKIKILKKIKSLEVGFHAHNNLGLAIVNSIKAIKAGAEIIDATSHGFGAGAGNTSLQTLVFALKKYKIKCDINEMHLNTLSSISDNFAFTPNNNIHTLLSGFYGIFSGFKPHIVREIKKYNLKEEDLYRELGKLKPVAGQEDLIITVAKKLFKKKK
jgi:4-hydroxy 2-oxovalerate aldolase